MINISHIFMKVALFVFLFIQNINVLMAQQINTSVTDLSATDFATSSFVFSYDSNGNMVNRDIKRETEESKSRKSTELSGINLDSLTFNVVVSPNPAKDFIRIQISPLRSECMMEIYNLSGVKVLSYKIINPVSFLNIGKYPAGVYLLKITNGKRQCCYRLIKE